MDKNTGGQAFPEVWGSGLFFSCNSGMTLRDYFASQALVALIIGGGSTSVECAEKAYQLADSMIKLREK